MEVLNSFFWNQAIAYLSLIQFSFNLTATKKPYPKRRGRFLNFIDYFFR